MVSNLTNNNLYTVIVAGNVDLSEYDANKIVTPYIAYRYSERDKIRQQAINIYRDIIDKNLNKSEMSLFNDFLRLKLQDIEEMTDEEYFESITKEMSFDNETGNAITTINPNGKYRIIKEATIETALPLKGNIFECKVKDILNKNATIEDIEKNSKHWDYIMNCSPIIKNQYLNQYKNKETYAKVMSEPFFYNAFVSEETGWLEPLCDEQIQWVLNFKERFINNLHEDITLKVYNFIR